MARRYLRREPLLSLTMARLSVLSASLHLGPLAPQELLRVRLRRKPSTTASTRSRRYILAIAYTSHPPTLRRLFPTLFRRLRIPRLRHRFRRSPYRPEVPER